MVFLSLVTPWEQEMGQRLYAAQPSSLLNIKIIITQRNFNDHFYTQS